MLRAPIGARRRLAHDVGGSLWLVSATNTRANSCAVLASSCGRRRPPRGARRAQALVRPARSSARRPPQARRTTSIGRLQLQASRRSHGFPRAPVRPASPVRPVPHRRCVHVSSKPSSYPASKCSTWTLTMCVLCRMRTSRCTSAAPASRRSAGNTTWRGTDGRTLERHRMVSHRAAPRPFRASEYKY